MKTIKFRTWDEDAKIMGFGGIFIVNSTGELQTSAKAVNVMQFIGLLDRNGKEIYEGDILHVFNVGNGKVEYRGASFVVRYGNKTMQYVNLSTQDEIIGNIYENPELLL